MGKLYQENGLLSEEGERVFQEILDNKINVILSQGANENEIRLIGSLIQKRVGDMVSSKIQTKNEDIVKFSSMTDDEFENYLKTKYGPSWMHCSLTPEEFRRYPNLTDDEIKKNIKNGKELRESAQQATPQLSARLTRHWFKK